MGSLFSKNKKQVSRVTEQDKAVLQLKQQRDQLKQYQQKIIQILEKEKELAKKLLREGKKDRAKLLLKKKRFQESQLDKSEQQLDNLEKMTHDLEFAQIEVQVLNGLKEGNQALKKVHAMLSVDEIERILDETREGLEKQQEIDALLSGNLSPEDLEAVETELEKIMTEENVTDLSVEDIPSLPDVPETSLTNIKEAERMITREKILVPAT